MTTLSDLISIYTTQAEMSGFFIDKMKIYNVLSYAGDLTVDDGVTDATSTIQAAVNAASLTGGALFFPAGTYLISNAITVSSDSIKIYGCGFASKIIQSSREKNVFEVTGDNISIQDMLFQGDGLTTGVDFSKNNGIYASGAKNFTIKDCGFTKFESAGVQIRNCFDVTIQNNFCWNNTDGAFGNCSDIIAYSGTSGGKYIIANNFCLSNNDQGIAVNLLAGDTDIVISNNICVTCDENLNEITGLSGMGRRHGIELGYNGGNSGRTIVNGNLIKNTKWSGIYDNSIASNSGEFVITNNIIHNVAVEITEPLTGGIFLVGGGNDVISNNLLTNVLSNAAIRVTQSATVGNAFAVIDGNSISNCKNGIACNIYATNVSIKNNYVHDSDVYDISVVYNSGFADGGNVSIIGNDIFRTNSSYQSIYLDQQNSTKIITVQGNRINGYDKNGASSVNSAIYTRSSKIIAEQNYIYNFRYALYIEPFVTGRNTLYPKFDYNYVTDCLRGVMVQSSGTGDVAVFEGNVFNSVTNIFLEVSGFRCGYEGRRNGTGIEIFHTAAPVAGAWLANDRVLNTNPAAGGFIGWVCTTGGSPGTWKTYGPITA